jgi:hypothetical protein
MLPAKGCAAPKQQYSMKLVAIVGGALIGGMAGYFIGVTVACDWLYPSSNLCGIYGVFLTGPIGLASGAIGGWLISRTDWR